MFNMPITFGVERSISLPPAFILAHHHYAIRNDVDIDFGLGDFGNLGGIFTRIFSKMLLLGYRNLPYLGVAFEHDGFAYDILGHKEPVILETNQNGVAIALALYTDETSLFLADFHYGAFHFAGVGRIGGEVVFQLLYVDRAAFGDGLAVLYARLGGGDVTLGHRCGRKTAEGNQGECYSLHNHLFLSVYMQT